MENNSASPPSGLTERIKSIDALRGLTILVMIFVNDVAGVQGTPAWMKHIHPHDADGMTFVDVVFPAFLFIVGISIPFAIGRRLQQGESLWSIWQHIFTRALSLLIIGVFMVNTETIEDRGILKPALWTLVMYIAVVLVWNVPPREHGRKSTVMMVMRVAGIVLLAALAVLYRGNQVSGFIQMRPQWWGILGLIGWAYLVACIVYTLLRNQMAGMVGMIVLLYCLFIANAAGAFANLTWITNWVDIGSMLGSHAAITVSGVVLGMMLTPDSPLKTHAERMRWAILYGLGLAAAGYLLHTAHDVHKMFIINKIFATPPWCLWCSAITTWIWVAIYWLMDVQKWEQWAKILEPAGQNPLFAYVLAPILYAVFELLSMAIGTANFYNKLGSSFAIGFWRALIFAFVVTWLAGGLRRLGVQLRL